MRTDTNHRSICKLKWQLSISPLTNILLVSALFCAVLDGQGQVANATNTTNTTISGRITDGAGYHVILIDGNGKISTTKLPITGVFSLKATKLSRSTITLLAPDGRAFGPLVLASNKKRRQAFLGFSGKTQGKGQSKKLSLALGRIILKQGYAEPIRALPLALVSTRGTLVANTTDSGAPEGASSGGVSATTSRLFRGQQRPQLPLSLARKRGPKGSGSENLFVTSAQDLDADGLIDAIDPDIDGDGIVNITDPDFKGNDQATFSSLVVDFANTLNVNTGTLTQAAIDNAIGGANLFNIGFWFSTPPNSKITGGHVQCVDTNPYCNRLSGTAVYNGVIESNPAFRGQLWRTINSDGSGYPNLESISRNGNNGGISLTASVEPRQGTGSVLPGDTYLVNFTDAKGGIVGTKLLVLSPYLVTVPALSSYTTNNIEYKIDYQDLMNQPGSMSFPIVTDSSGSISFSFWRPQRLLYRSEIPLSNSDKYRDLGHLKYGILIEGVSRQFTCGGFYSIPAGSDLKEQAAPTSTSSQTSSGNQSPYADQGAELFPLRDESGDLVPNVNNTLKVGINLRGCLNRVNLPTGTYAVRLIARGEELSGGANSSSQMFMVTVN